MLQILAPLEFLDVLEEVLGLDTTTISDPIFEYSPPPINGVRVDPALFALDVGIFGKLVLLVVHIVMTEAKILGNLMEEFMEDSITAARITGSGYCAERVFMSCKKTGEECPKSLSNPQKRIPHPQNRGGGPLHPHPTPPSTLHPGRYTASDMPIYIYIYIYMI